MAQASDGVDEPFVDSPFVRSNLTLFHQPYAAAHASAPAMVASTPYVAYDCMRTMPVTSVSYGLPLSWGYSSLSTPMPGDYNYSTPNQPSATVLLNDAKRQQIDAIANGRVDFSGLSKGGFVKMASYSPPPTGVVPAYMARAIGLRNAMGCVVDDSCLESGSSAKPMATVRESADTFFNGMRLPALSKDKRSFSQMEDTQYVDFDAERKEQHLAVAVLGKSNSSEDLDMGSMDASHYSCDSSSASTCPTTEDFIKTLPHSRDLQTHTLPLATKQSMDASLTTGLAATTQPTTATVFGLPFLYTASPSLSLSPPPPIADIKYTDHFAEFKSPMGLFSTTPKFVYNLGEERLYAGGGKCRNGVVASYVPPIKRRRRRVRATVGGVPLKLQPKVGRLQQARDWKSLSKPVRERRRRREMKNGYLSLMRVVPTEKPRKGASMPEKSKIIRATILEIRRLENQMKELKSATTTTTTTTETDNVEGEESSFETSANQMAAATKLQPSECSDSVE